MLKDISRSQAVCNCDGKMLEMVVTADYYWINGPLNGSNSIHI